MNTRNYARDVGLARYSVISPLVSRQYELRIQYHEEARRIAATRHRFPNDEQHTVSARQIRRWVQWYKQGRRIGVRVLKPGLEALTPLVRDDAGVPRVLDPAIIERAIRLRAEEPSRTTRTLVELLQAEAKQRGEELDLGVKTLAYHLRARRATRKVLKQDGKVYPRYEHFHRNDCWQGDMTGGMWLPHPHNSKKARQCFLHAFIDDKTRRAWGEFYFRQNLPCLSDCFRKTIFQYGLPSMVYWDNGPAYQAKQVHLMAARLGIQVVSATPYRPEGKGKIERFFGHVKSSFYPEALRAGLQTLEELNQFFRGWIEQYNNREHSELGMSPVERWALEDDTTPLRWPDPHKLVEAFLWEEERKVNKSGCIDLASNAYPVPEHLVGQTVTVRFDPFDMSKIRIYHKDVFVDVAQPQQLVSHTHRKALPRRTEKPAPLESSKRWRDQLAGDFEQKVLASMENGAPAGRHADGLTRAEFGALLVELLGGRTLTQRETNMVADFFLRYAPLTQSMVRSALLAATDTKGTALHLRFYLEAIRNVRGSEGGR